MEFCHQRVSKGDKHRSTCDLLCITHPYQMMYGVISNNQAKNRITNLWLSHGSTRMLGCCAGSFIFGYIRLCSWRRYTWFIEMRKHKLPQGYVCVCVCSLVYAYAFVVGLLPSSLCLALSLKEWILNQTEPNQEASSRENVVRYFGFRPCVRKDVLCTHRWIR